MEEESDGPDVVAIGLRETATSGVAGAETDASRGGASALFAGIDASPSLPSLGEQREQLEPLLPLLTKNQKQKLRQKRCRLAKRLRMQVRELKKERRRNVKKKTRDPNECLFFLQSIRALRNRNTFDYTASRFSQS